MLNFNEETHTYTNEEGKVLVSVTTLLKWAGISPNYDNVREDILKAKAERGTLIHKEIEDYVKKGEVGFTAELQSFIKYITENDIEVLASEKMVNNDDVAGTIDLIVRYRKNGKVKYVDLKTTSTTYKNSVSWQLSIYKDLDNEYPDAELEVWHFLADGDLEVKEIDEIEKEAILNLYEAYKNGTDFKVAISNSDLAELYEAEKIIAYFENEKTKAETNAKKVREKIIDSMKKMGLTKFENDKIIISYIAPTTAETFDSVKFKAENPEEYKKWVRTTTKKEQVRIKLKGEK